MTDAQKLSNEYFKLTKQLTLSEVEYSIKYAIVLLTKLSSLSIELHTLALKGDKTITPIQRKLIVVLLHYKANVLKKLLGATQKELNAYTRKAIAYDANNMDLASKKLMESIKSLYTEELQFCLRYALSYKDDKNFNLKQAQAIVKKNLILKPMLKRAISAMLEFRSIDLKSMLKNTNKK